MSHAEGFVRRRRAGIVVGVALALLVALVGSGLWFVGSVGAQEPTGPADPEVTRDEVRELLAGGEYDYEPSWMERFFEWLGEQLDKLLPDAEPTSGGGVFMGGIGTVLAYLIIIVAVVAIVAAIVYVLVRRVRRPEREDEPESTIEVEHRRSVRQWQGDAAAHEAAGEWKEALRARYRALVRELTDRGQLPDIAGRTTGELRADLATTTPAAAADFDTASLLFELPWYADAPTGPAENEQFREAAAAVLAAPRLAADVTDPSDGVSRGPQIEVTV